jgi:hypothetical protein
MAKQSRLEIKGLEKRKDLISYNDYQHGDTTEYNENHPDALSDGDPLGKGTGVPLGVAKLPGETTLTTISYSNIDTRNGGGLYDIEGRNGVGGRTLLKTMNLYNENNAYGLDSVDTSANVLDGQYTVN